MVLLHFIIGLAAGLVIVIMRHTISIRPLVDRKKNILEGSCIKVQDGGRFEIS